VLMVRVPPPRPPAFSVHLRPREVAPQPQDRQLIRPPRRPQLPVWRLCRMFPYFWEARTPRRGYFLFQLRARQTAMDRAEFFSLRDDLAAHIFVDRGSLLEPCL